MKLLITLINCCLLAILGQFDIAAANSSVEKCESCHNVQAWQPARFNHDKTSFALKGKHTSVTCKSCHAENNYKLPGKHRCMDCHHDPHVGELGTTCEKCHNEDGWRSESSMANSLLAHRRTNFPLTGRHALIPCQECHPSQRERTFSRTALPCYGCHQLQYLNTRQGSIDHVTAGFSTECESCHSPLHWLPARNFLAHDTCFTISHGQHAQFTCVQCHNSTVGFTFAGTCSGTNFSCTGCHTGAHAQSKMDSAHIQVQGYQYQNLKCYECHRQTN